MIVCGHSAKATNAHVATNWKVLITAAESALEEFLTECD
jgi:hypothetical protein